MSDTTAAFHSFNSWTHEPVASLVLDVVSPEAATEGVTPIPPPQKKTDDLLSSPYVCLSVLQCHPYLFSSEKPTAFFTRHCHFYLFHSGVTRPLEGVTP